MNDMNEATNILAAYGRIASGLIGVLLERYGNQFPDMAGPLARALSDGSHLVLETSTDVRSEMVVELHVQGPGGERTRLTRLGMDRLPEH